MKQFTIFIFFVLLFTLGCSKNPPKRGYKAEAIYRFESEKTLLAPPQLMARAPYSWENAGSHPKITKEFFRCKGSSESQPYQREGSQETLLDCKGSHGLPLKEGEEFVYPILLELLNMLQKESGKRVIITTGHRCPTHNRYADPAPENTSSKHMIGAEVDFYIEGFDPLIAIQLIQNYYKKSEDASYREFLRYDKPGCRVSTPPWYNKEIFIKLYLPNEGRDKDNLHPYPYIGIQVRTDRDTNETVSYTPQQAQNYLR